MQYVAARYACENAIDAANKSAKGEWGERHRGAWALPRGPERGIKQMISALAIYADNHFQTFESPIGEDGYGGPEWLAMVHSCQRLLSMETGRLDCGTLDGMLRDMVRSAGFSATEADTLECDR